MWRETASSLVNGLVKVFQSTPSVWRETYCPSSSGDSDHGFQSTPSVWRETGRLSGGMTDVSDFNPLPPCGGRRAAVLLTITTLRFQSTPSVWRETRRSASFMTCCWISIHSLRVEGDPYDTKKLAEITNFNPLPPCGGRRFVAGRPGVRRYFNPLPPCGGRRSPLVSMACRSTISIHSLRVEGDVAGDDLRDTVGNFNPLPPCGGRLPICLKPASLNDFNPLPPCGGRHYSTLAPMCQMESMEFQSTPSVWRETYQIGAFFATPVFQSTPSVWRETRTPEQLLKSLNISIHSLRVEGDEMYRQSAAQQTLFQSTPSVWRETQTLWAALSTSSISIHSLRVEGDPRGRRRTSQRQKFQSTPSVWRETLLGVPLPDILKISIHSLRVEGDDVSRMLLFAYQISIHSLRVEGDSKIAQLSA